MAEVASSGRSEDEAYIPVRTFPPPPTDKLPTPPGYSLSDGEFSFMEGIARLMKRQNTVHGVTEEARKVLEQFLKRSIIQEYGEESYNKYYASTMGGTGNLPDVPSQFSYSNVLDELFEQKMRQLSLESKSVHSDFDEKMRQLGSKSEPSDYELEECDYVYTHQIIKETKELAMKQGFVPYTPPSYRSESVFKRADSPCERLKLSVHPPTIKPKHKYSKSKYIDEDLSSTSTEDYEYTDPNEFLRRKKKSFFRRATERLMHSFRRRKEHPPDADMESPKDERPRISESKSAGSSPLKPKKKKKMLQQTIPKAPAINTKTRHFVTTPTDLAEQVKFVEFQREMSLKGSSSGDNGSANVTLERPEGGRGKSKSPLPWKRWEVRPKVKDEEREKGVLDNILKQIRKGSFKLKKKGSKEHKRTRSDETLAIRPLTKEHEKVLKRYAADTSVTVSDSENSSTVRSFSEVSRPPPSSPAPAPPTSNVPTPQHILRQRMTLEGLVSCTDPDYDVIAQQESALDYDYDEIEDIIPGEGKETLQQHDAAYLARFDSEGNDDVDGLRRMLMGSSSKPFHERSGEEKEVLYEKIAEQLAAIADHYNRGSPSSIQVEGIEGESVDPEVFAVEEGASAASVEVDTPSRGNKRKSSSSEAEGAAGPKVEASKRNSKSSSNDDGDIVPIPRKRTKSRALERQLSALVKMQGEKPLDLTPMVTDLVRNASYSKFKQVVNENIGEEPGWQQIALMFRMTQTAVQLAGMGSAVALQMKEMTLQYFEDKYAGWIVGQGGWESVVEDTNTELDSELD